jgi:hypothetical protein
MIEEINEWPEGVNIRKGLYQKQIRDIHIIKKKMAAGMYHLKGMMQ